MGTKAARMNNGVKFLTYGFTLDSLDKATHLGIHQVESLDTVLEDSHPL